jgi:MOSC domain-containing protein YiiM
VTLINATFFKGSIFTFPDSRRNILTEDIELMGLIGKEFTIGAVMLRGVKYCDPCNRPNDLSGIAESFREAFFDRGGLIAEILTDGVIRIGDRIAVRK